MRQTPTSGVKKSLFLLFMLALMQFQWVIVVIVTLDFSITTKTTVIEAYSFTTSRSTSIKAAAVHSWANEKNGASLVARHSNLFSPSSLLKKKRTREKNALQQKLQLQQASFTNIVSSILLFVSSPFHSTRFLAFRDESITLSRPILSFLNQRRRAIILTTVISWWILTTWKHARQVRRRQALDATSEWNRFARYPAARGRAFFWTLFQLMPYFMLESVILKPIIKHFDDKRARRALSKSRTHGGEKMASSLLKLGPLYIKLGQIISCRNDFLSDEWKVALERLQDCVPAQTGQKALDLAHEAMGGKQEFDNVFSSFDTTPLAAASLGQVHRATLRQNGEIVAVKLQRPNLRQIYNQDFKLLMRLATMMDAMNNFFAKRKSKKTKTNDDDASSRTSVSWTAIFKDAKDILYREIDYRDEAENSIRIAQDFGIAKGGKDATTGTAKTKRKNIKSNNNTQRQSYSKDGQPLPSAASWLRIPHVYSEFSSEKALVMEFVPSIKINNIPRLEREANITTADREYLADCLARAYLRSFCVHQFFSTDPHPGNLGVEIVKTNDEKGRPRLVMYDFGQACSLQPDQADGILDVIEAIVDMDADRCVDAFEKMGVLRPNADLKSIRAKVRDNFETGKIKVKQKKLKKMAGYRPPEDNDANGGTASSSDDDKKKTKKEEKVNDAQIMSYFTLPAQYAFVARAISQMDGVGKTLDPDFDFISSAAPNIVEIKGTGKYISDEWSKRVDILMERARNWLNNKSTVQAGN